MNRPAPGVLMVAFHFPPCVGSSGLLRSFCFSRDLAQFGWQPEILSAAPLVYDQTSSELLDGIPTDVRVHRALAFDTQKHFSIGGRYPDFLAVPDRMISWLPAAVVLGLLAIWRSRPRYVWSTYPIPTSHLIGYLLARLSKRPWIADFRDPMVEYIAATDSWAPADARIRKARLRIEKLCVDHARALVFCTEGARRICVERYGRDIESRCFVVANGYDEEIFAALEPAPSAPAASDPLTLLHSGIIYPTADRDPSHFLAAVVALQARGLLRPGVDRVVFRASGYDEWLNQLIVAHGAEQLVEVAGRLPYADALKEIMAASGLLVFQGYTSNPAIPAKVYEYIRSGRPIFAMADSAGDTAALLRRLGTAHIADLTSASEIELQLADFILRARDGSLAGVPRDQAVQFSRTNRARELAALLDRLDTDP